MERVAESVLRRRVAFGFETAELMWVVASLNLDRLDPLGGQKPSDR
jgi:hypothetical protein